MIKNNSKPENFYKQTNNRRSPYVSCFNTSMINGSQTVNIPLPERNSLPEDEAFYDQPEDQFDVHVHCEKVINHFENDRDVQKLLAEDYDYREIFAVEEYAFNDWVGKRVCKFIDGLTMENMINIYPKYQGKLNDKDMLLEYLTKYKNEEINFPFLRLEDPLLLVGYGLVHDEE